MGNGGTGKVVGNGGKVLGKLQPETSENNS